MTEPTPSEPTPPAAGTSSNGHSGNGNNIEGRTNTGFSSLATSISAISPPSDSNAEDEVDSLPSPSTASVSTTSTEAAAAQRESDAEREWRESLQQLQLLLSMVLVPYMGKYFGRKFAYYCWARYMEWKYPVEVVMTSPATFKAAGAVGVVAASL